MRRVSRAAPPALHRGVPTRDLPRPRLRRSITGAVTTSTELSTLTALARALSRPAALADSLDAALTTVAELLGLDTGWVWLLDERDPAADPVLAAARALPPGLAEHPEAMRGDCYCLARFRAGEAAGTPVPAVAAGKDAAGKDAAGTSASAAGPALAGAMNVNVVWCSRLAKVDGADAGEGAPLRCHASVPLAAGDRKLGMLNVASADRRVLSDDELNLLTTVGALVSLVVERARLEAAGVRAAAAEERNRVAREIHDTLAQALAALTMQLETADAVAAEGADARLARAVERSLALARATLDEARHSVLDLRASPLGGRSLGEALAALAEEQGAAGHAPVRLTIEGLDETGPRAASAVPAAVAVGLERIARQALANVARHAGATSATVRLSREAAAIRLRVEDDGAGFDPAAVPRDRFGLVGMRERARLLGGTLAVESAPGAGTAIEAVIPLPAGGSRP